MCRLKVVLRVAAFGLVLGIPHVPAMAAPADVWLAGLDPISRQAKFPGTRSDYMDLFQPNAPWSRAASMVKVFELGPKFAAEASDETLSQIFTDLRRRNIALAIGASWLPGSDTCGRGVEGFTHPGTAESVAERLQRIGIDVKYVVLDEPLYFGHECDKQNACRWPIDEVARQLATGIAAFKHVFPAVQICDSEPVAIPDAGWTDKITQWSKAFQSATGVPLACLHADMQWTGPWQQQLRELRSRLHAIGIKLGIIYNGDGTAQTGVEWARQSEQRFRAVEANPALTPDQALIQSWTRQPDHMLPDSQPGTMTNLILQYVQRHGANSGN